MLSRTKSRTLRAAPPRQPQNQQRPQSSDHQITANANVAAVNAFNSHQKNAATSPISLSAAAATAALRANPTPKTNVAQVQTKRNLRRRSSSLSSTSSTKRAFGRLSPPSIIANQGSPASARRSPSVSSMTERTFRAQSPAMLQRETSTPSGSGPLHSASSRNTTRPLLTSNGRDHQRSSSASDRNIGSHKRSSSENAPRGFASSQNNDSRLATAVKTSQPVRPRAQSFNARPTSPNLSINFSYPRPTKSTSSDAITEEPEETMVYDANSRRLVPKSQLDALNRDLQMAGALPSGQVAKSAIKRSTNGINSSLSQSGKTSRSLKNASSGSRSGPSTRTRPKSSSSLPSTPADLITTPSGPMSSAHRGAVTAQNQSLPHTLPAKKEAMQPTQPNSLHNPSRQKAPSTVPRQSSHSGLQSQLMDSASHVSQSSLHFNVVKSSTVRPVSTGSAVALGAVGSSQGLKASSTHSSTLEEKSVVIDAWHADSVRFMHTAPSHTTPLPSRPASSHFPTASQSTATISSEQLPVFSSSSSDSQNSEMQARHIPPSRSLSPRKSALKASRPQSASNIMSSKPRSMSEDVNFESAGKKVSFDQATVMHPDDFFYASDGGGAPQKKGLRWLSSLGRSRRKEKTTTTGSEFDIQNENTSSTSHSNPTDSTPALQELTAEDSHDFTSMGLLPPLPSFKSIRGKQPDVFAQDSSRLSGPQSTLPPDTTLYEPRQLPTIRSGTELNTDYMEADSHYGLDQILSDENTKAIKDQDNTSRFCEPLPPIVTSVDGTGYGGTPSPISDDSEDAFGSVSGLGSVDDYHHPVSPIDEEVPPVAPDPPCSQVSTPQSSQYFAQSTSDFLHSPHDVVNAYDQSISGSDGDMFPGDFPHALDGTGSQADVDEMSYVKPRQQLAAASSRLVRFAEDLPTRPAEEQSNSDSDSEGSSVYTDAYEDFDGDGFQSLNAVITTNLITQSSPSELSSSNTGVQGSKLSTVSETLLEGTGSTLGMEQSTPTLSSVASPNSNDETPSQSPMSKSTVSPQTSIIYNSAVSRNIMAQDNNEMDWEKAKAYWKSLSPEKRRQLEFEAQDNHTSTTQQTSSQAPMSPQSLFSFQGSTNDELGHIYEANAQAQIVSTISAQAHIVSTFGAQTQRNSQVVSDGDVLALKTNEPMAQADSPGQEAVRKERKIKKSLRGHDSENDNDSVVGSVRRSNLQKKLRPFSYSASSTQPTLAASHDTQRHASLDIPPVISQDSSSSGHTLQRQDSESSFRRSKSKADGVFGSFRNSTMRDSPMASTERIEPAKHGKFRLRSFSPAGFRRGSSPPALGPSTSESTLRKSMRDPISSGRKSIFSKTIKAPGSRGSARLSSRFDQSSDEESGFGVSAFQSRYADSSDDETPSRPVTGDLTGSHSESFPPINQSLLELARKSLAASNQIQTNNPNDSLHTLNAVPGNESASKFQSSMTDSDLKAAIAPKSKKSRDGKGIMGALRRRKDTSKKIQRAPPSESAARRDTPLERSASEISALRTDRTAPKGTYATELGEDIEPTPSSATFPSSGPRRADKAAAPWPLAQDTEELHELERVSSMHSVSKAALGTSSVNRACASDLGGYKGLGVSALATKSSSNTALPSFTSASIMGCRQPEVGMGISHESHGTEERLPGAGPAGKRKFGKLRKILRIAD
ncbi:hypothetical protein CFIMG_007319RA00001 [Ceratocystis fimbriata CBS 114723]|uniref:Uncharacterized protein n=1 Tax=Ceratocystis fimbriata CBS 114723 TaxID=1035309 RepID=A0A2C5WYC6_9PEZI|nr:hypothetical protein CFIMG_007319RA00001 [Ceratocystis fimbriata CBS 114723]